jgi:thiol-disulfide isomerase/thioredoxin
MKRNIILVIFIFYSLLAYAQTESGAFTVAGHIDKLSTGTIFFNYQASDNHFLSDSCKITDGQFSFAGQIAHPARCYLQLTSLRQLDRNVQVFYLEQNTINVELSTDPLTIISVNGSKTNDELMEWRNADKEIASKFSSVLNSSPPKSDTTTIKKYEDSLALCAAERYAAEYNFIRLHPQSYITPDLLIGHYRYYTADQLKQIYDGMGDRLQSSASGQYLLKNIALMSGVSVGGTAVNIVSKDYITGNTFDLSQQHGKFVLIDFWGSWCQPCMRLLPEQVIDDAKYRDKNIVFVSVAFDNDERQNQCREIVKRLGMTWINLWSSQDKKTQDNIANTYNIGTYPAFILIDPNGKIIAKEDSESGYYKIKQLLAATLKP